MDMEARVVELFELITHRKVALLENPRSKNGAISLAKAQLTLEPRLKVLEEQVEQLFHQHRIDSSQFNRLRNAEAVLGMIVGICAGLDLAQRPDIVGAFAKMYAQDAEHCINSLFQTTVRELARRAN